MRCNYFPYAREEIDREGMEREGKMEKSFFHPFFVTRKRRRKRRGGDRRRTG